MSRTAEPAAAVGGGFVSTPDEEAVPPPIPIASASSRLPPWALPLAVLAAAGLFTLVVNVVHLGFSSRWADPVGYVSALLRPLLYTLPAYVLLRIALGWGSWSSVLAEISRPLRLASLTLACWAPVIWFYLLTSPTPTFPLFAFGFGCLAFWVPLIWDLLRTATAGKERALAILWASVMVATELRSITWWLAAGIEAARAAGGAA